MLKSRSRLKKAFILTRQCVTRTYRVPVRAPPSDMGVPSLFVRLCCSPTFPSECWRPRPRSAPALILYMYTLCDILVMWSEFPVLNCVCLRVRQSCGGRRAYYRNTRVTGYVCGFRIRAGFLPNKSNGNIMSFILSAKVASQPISTTTNRL